MEIDCLGFSVWSSPLHGSTSACLHRCWGLIQAQTRRREIALRLIHQKKTMAYINQRLRNLGADILFQEEFEEISTIERKARYLCNFASLKEELNQEMPL